MLQKIRNIVQLGVKELWGLSRDPLLMGLIIYSFTIGIYTSAKSFPDSIEDAAIAIVDEDNSPLSIHVVDGFRPPMFRRPAYISRAEIDPALDQGVYTFVLVIPSNFQKDVLAGNVPEVQLNVDATRMSQAFIGSNYIQQIALMELNDFVAHQQGAAAVPPASINIRNRFNPNLLSSWEGAVTEFVNNITMIAIILTGAAFIRERERGTLEHLLVMPVTPFEIMVSKIWSMSLIVLIVSALSEQIVIQRILKIPMAGSFTLFLLGVILHLFAVTSMGIFLACFAKSMPQFGILVILVLMPMQILSGGMAQQGMPPAIDLLMQLTPTRHFVKFSSAILFRGAEFFIVWKQLLQLGIIGAVLFVIAVSRFRKTVAA